MSEKTKHIITCTLLILTSAPFALIVKHPSQWSLSSANTSSIALYVSSVFGYIGISLLVWMYTLGTRSITGLYFKDLGWTLKIHRWLGTYGVVFVLLHPFLTAYSYGESILTYWITPQLGTEFQQHVTLGRIGFIMLLLVWVTSALIRGKIAYRPWKYIHYVSYVVLPLSLLHTREIGSSVNRPWVQTYFYSFVVIYLVITALRARHVCGYGKVGFTITEHKELTPDVFMIKLTHPTKKIEIHTGQYVYIQRNLFSEEHPFSVVDFNNETGEVSIAYKVFGSFTKKLSAMSVGENVLVDGPYGVFTKEIELNNTTPAVFIAGGIGITPFVKHIMQRASGQNTWLFYANRTHESATFRGFLKGLLGVRYVDVFSRESGPSIPQEVHGYITSEALTSYLQDPQDYIYFMCGPSSLMESGREVLVQLGVPTHRIHTEEFSF